MIVRNSDKCSSRILVTGAAGFIGSHVCEALLQRGDAVVGLDVFDDFYDPDIKRDNIRGVMKHDKFALCIGDIRDEQSLMRAMDADVDTVIHLAARAGVRPSIEHPRLYQDININGTLAVLEACRLRNVKRMIFASSSSVYGNNNKVPFSESDNVDHPVSPYAATKKAGELLCHTYHHLCGMDITCLRFFTVYGARQRPDLAIHRFARLIKAGEPIPMFGDGSSVRDYTYIEDIVQGVLRAVDCCDGYAIFNLGNSTPVSLSTLISALEEAVGNKAIIKRLPRQPGDVLRTYADIERAREHLGYAPTTSLPAGLARFAEWLRARDAKFEPIT